MDDPTPRTALFNGEWQMKSVNTEHLRVVLGVIVWIIMIALSQESVAASGDALFAAPAIHERAADHAP
jgi:hypothetical protein